MHTLENNIQTYFGKISPEEIEIIASYFKPATIPKGEVLVRTGNYCNFLSFIQQGIMRIYVPFPDKEVTQWICTDGYFLTDLSSFLFQSPARFTIETLTDVEMMRISKEDYQQLAHKIPKWHELEKLFIAKCFTTIEERVLGFLSLSAEERYTLFFEQNKDLFLQVPLQYIASMLGMTPETFSRIRKKLNG